MPANIGQCRHLAPLLVIRRQMCSNYHPKHRSASLGGCMIQPSRSLNQNQGPTRASAPGLKSRKRDGAVSETEPATVQAESSDDAISPKSESATESTIALASWNKDQVALSKFFGRSAPLVVPKSGFDHWLDALLTPVEGGKVLVEEDDSDPKWEDISLEAYSDEYAKIFSSFNPFTPPTTSRTSITNPMLSRHRQLNADQLRGERSSTGSAELDRLFESISNSNINPSNAKGSSALKGPSDGLDNGIDQSETTFFQLEGLAAEVLKISLQSKSLTSVGRQSRIRTRMPTQLSSEAIHRILAESALFAGHGELVERGSAAPAVEAISIKKRRRQKMNKHKWKKLRRDLRDSTRYNKEKRKKSGPMREKQE